MNLFTEAEKQDLQSVFEDIHDTFARPITIWKEPERVAISTTDDFNYVYGGDQPNVEYENVAVSGTFPARIRWRDPMADQNWQDIRPDVPGQICRLKLREDAYQFLSGVQRIDIDGIPGELHGTVRPHGLIDIQFYTVFVRQTEAN